MAWAIALIAILVAGLMAQRNRFALASFAAFVAAIALFIAYPDSLYPDFLSLGTTGTLIVLLVAIIGLMATIAIKMVPNAVAVVAMVAAMWALCRLIPTLPPAFANLAPELGQAARQIWDALVVFVREASGA